MPHSSRKYAALSLRPYRRRGSQRWAAGPFDVRAVQSTPPPARMVRSRERSSSDVKKSMHCGTKRLLVV